MYDRYPLNILTVKNFCKSFGRQVALSRRVAPLPYTNLQFHCCAKIKVPTVFFFFYVFLMGNSNWYLNKQCHAEASLFTFWVCLFIGQTGTDGPVLKVFIYWYGWDWTVQLLV
jgi:hypothetical protein